MAKIKIKKIIGIFILSLIALAIIYVFYFITQERGFSWILWTLFAVVVSNGLLNFLIWCFDYND